jgi:hypothetical protein
MIAFALVVLAAVGLGAWLGNAVFEHDMRQLKRRGSAAGYQFPQDQ